MYKIPSFIVPEGYKVGEYALLLCRDIREGNNVEDAKDKLFRMTYPIMLQEVKKYKNIAPVSELVSDLSLAFMRTLNRFDPYREGTSFINYYKRALYSEIIQNNFGKYKNNEQDKKLKRTFEGTIASLDDKLYDKNDAETGTWHDLIEDINADIDADLLEEDYKNTVHVVINKVFNKRRQGKKSDNPKLMFTDYVDSIMNDAGIKNLEISAKYNVGKTAVSNTITKYWPSFIEAYEDTFDEM